MRYIRISLSSTDASDLCALNCFYSAQITLMRLVFSFFHQFEMHRKCVAVCVFSIDHSFYLSLSCSHTFPSSFPNAEQLHNNTKHHRLIAVAVKLTVFIAQLIGILRAGNSHFLFNCENVLNWYNEAANERCIQRNVTVAMQWSRMNYNWKAKTSCTFESFPWKSLWRVEYICVRVYVYVYIICTFSTICRQVWLLVLQFCR